MMAGKRIISLATIVAMLVSLVMPAYSSTHHCAGTEAVVQSLTHSHEHDHGAIDGHHDHEAEATVDEAGHHYEGLTEHHHEHTLGDSGYSFCCAPDRLVPHSTLDVATLSSSVGHGLVLPLLIVTLPFFASNHDVTLITPGYKIESSPPFLAALSRHTYIRTSALLI